ncbi:hypothetical protein [Actinoplanes sp. NPDC049265]|uniref:hypothetical protein n=1 Tax=Actinoplanes sp. NPDC049265 TaxID=3363902 RepID=UPI0037137B00
MSDFDDVLERLLTDPSFAAALAADPDAALAGYRLDAGEIDLLRSQVSGDAGRAAAAVEGRTTKSSTFGLFSSLGDFSAFGSAAGAAAHHIGEVAAPTGSALGAASADGALGVAPASGAFGAASAHGVLGDAPVGGSGGALGVASAHGVLGDAPVGGSGGALGAASAHGVLGDAPGHGLDDLPARAGFGDAPRAGLGDAAPPAHAEPLHRATAPMQGGGSAKGVGDYHNRVDADGDGHWDKATYSAREDGGVDIMVDVNHDGKVDFIGRDLDRDWKVDEATIDRDRDGVFEKTMYDDNNDGWLDRTVWHKD